MTANQTDVGSAQKPVEIIFYSHQDCHLCGDMEVKLIEFIKNLAGQIAVNVQMRDIEEQAHWYTHYHEYVPVLVVNDEEICHYFLDSDELMNALVRASGSSAISHVILNTE